jgi:hypothetical protein
MLKKHRKNVLQSKRIEKKRERKHTPLQTKSKKRISKHGVFKKNTIFSHTCTSRSSCMTGFFLDPVFGLTISCGISESLLPYPKLHIQAIKVGS